MKKICRCSYCDLESSLLRHNDPCLRCFIGLMKQIINEEKE